ncbi:MAG: ABC transporter ATP-binding protein, partial [Sphingobacteriales bacterium]
MSTDAAADKISRTSILKRVFSFAKPYRKKFYWSVFLAIFLALIAPVRPLLIQITINDGLKGNELAHFI